MGDFWFPAYVTLIGWGCSMLVIVVMTWRWLGRQDAAMDRIEGHIVDAQNACRRAETLLHECKAELRSTDPT